MRNTDRSAGLRSHPHQITIEGSSQIIKISSSYGSLLNQNIQMGPSRISITQNGQQVQGYHHSRSVLPVGRAKSPSTPTVSVVLATSTLMFALVLPTRNPLRNLPIVLT